MHIRAWQILGAAVLAIAGGLAAAAEPAGDPVFDAVNKGDSAALAPRALDASAGPL